MSTTRTTSLPLVPGRWKVDTAHSSVGFTIRHLGVAKVRGRFGRFDANVMIGETLETTSVSATIDVASLDTANADRDAHVLSADILDVARRPTLTFVSTRITGAGSEFRVEGELTIGDVTRPLVLNVEFGGQQAFPGGAGHAGFEATAELRRRDFGIDLAAMPPGSDALLGNVVKLELDLELLEPEG